MEKFEGENEKENFLFLFLYKIENWMKMNFFSIQQKCPYIRAHGLPQVAFIYLLILSTLGSNVTFCLCFVLGNVVFLFLFLFFYFYF